MINFRMKLPTHESTNGVTGTSAEGEGEATTDESGEGHGDKGAEVSEPPVSLADLLGYVLT